MASPTFGLSRAHRLVSPEQFSAGLRSRPAARGAMFTCHWCKHLPSEVSDPNVPKLGFIVPKRLARLAVLRNAIKRVLREAFRHQKGSLRGGYYVFRLKSKLEPASLSQLKRELRREADLLLKKAGSTI